MLVDWIVVLRFFTLIVSADDEVLWLLQSNPVPLMKSSVLAESAKGSSSWLADNLSIIFSADRSAARLSSVDSRIPTPVELRGTECGGHSAMAKR